jgi:hypothetical protein
MSATRVAMRFEKSLAIALTAPDPVRSVRRIGRDARLPMNLRRSLRRARAPQIEMCALLIARLRFERLLRGCPEAEAWFERDPATFSIAFRRYHSQVRPTAFFPPHEATLFRAWNRSDQRRESNQKNLGGLGALGGLSA